MLFNSFIFIFAFLPITFFIYFYLNTKRLTEAGKAFLVFSSLFFYSWWNVAYLPLILTSMLFNYALGRQLSNYGDCKRPYSKKGLLAVGVVFNLSLLGYFKYSDFFITNFNALFGADVTLMHLALPLAISFYTFQQIAYLVDSYRNETKEYDFLNYAVFVAFFPQLIAGPIVHHAEMMPQFEKLRNKVINFKNIMMGLFIFNVGLFKKVIIADTFAKWATQGFDTAAVLNFYEAWCTSLSYSMQLYYDFSGYTDMAIGIALLFNIKLPMNFNSPYKATSIQDFWRRWHMTLSRFLKDYIYIPFGGNRKGGFRTYVNLFATFLLGGIWHGAGWTFVFWGALHGGALVLNRMWQKFGFKMNTLLAWFITFNFVNVAWVFFRAKSWDDAVKVLEGMVDISVVGFENISFWNNLHGIGGDIFTILWLSVIFPATLFLKNTNAINKSHITIFTTLVMSFVFMISVYHLTDVSEFLYFNF